HRNCFFGLTGMRVIDAQVDQRISLGLEHMMLLSNFQSLPIEFQSALEILQLTMNPANAVGHAGKPEQIAIPARHADRLLESGERFRHAPEISQRQTEKKQRSQQQKAIAQF